MKSKIIETSTGNPIATISCSNLSNWNTSPMNQTFGGNIPVLANGTSYIAKVTVSNNGACSGVFNFPFITQ